MFLRHALAAASLLLTPAIARAEPSIHADAPAGDGRADVYVAVGGQLGAIADEAMVGLSADADVRIWRWLWGHAGVAVGEVPVILGGNDDGDYQQGLLGLTARGCAHDTAAICGFVGIDVGVLRMAPPFAMTTVDPIVVPRIGVDLGGDTVRFRPMVAFPIRPDDTGLVVTASLAAGF